MSDHRQDSTSQPYPTTAPDTPPAAPMFSRAAWVRIIPFVTYIAFVVIVDLLTRAGIDPAALRWMYALKVGTVLVLLVVFWRHYTELHSLAVSPKWGLISVVLGVVVWYLWISLNADWMIIGSPAGFDPRTGGEIDWLMVAVRIAGAALIVPVMEELFWRSFLMRWIDNVDFQRVDPRAVSPLAVAITVVLFAFEHNQWLAGVVAGFAYSALYMRQRSLWSAILAHAVTNGVLGVWIVRSGMWTYW